MPIPGLDTVCIFIQKLLAVSGAAAIGAFSYPILYVGTALILFAERLFPVDRGQKTFTMGFFQDIVWVGLQAIAAATLLSVYVKFLVSVYRAHLDFLTVRGIEELPLLLKYAIWILVVDLTSWFHHWVKHKVPWFWQLHAVHHSQKEMNLFTDLRYHAFEYLISRTLVTFPLLMLQTNLEEIVYFNLFHAWYTRMYHARIRSDFGWLRYILVTPQSHRIHHSLETIHHDKNFGVIFSFWDRLFGTQYTGWQEYPKTGIRDKSFPVETSVKGLSLLVTPIRQNLYPLGNILRSLFRI
jgi:sterol desaturase/sphingolipid hydroxylase (fatty acid hydroxylase superfamily)